jgi:hypothetical protein
MKRRDALQKIGYGSMLSLAIPSWANAWNKNSIPVQTAEYNVYFEKFVDALLPETDKPGALKAGVATFIEAMVNDTFDNNSKAKVKQGIADMNKDAQAKFNTDFSSLSNNQVTELLKSYDAMANKPWIYSSLRGLSIWGYTTSEYYMTEIQKFEFAPGYFIGCQKLEA